MKTPLQKRMVLLKGKNSKNKRYEIDCISQNNKRNQIQFPPLSKSVNIEHKCSINNKNDNIDLFIEDNEEFNEIMNYLNNLDYEKYKHDYDMKEALLIIKHKMEKEANDKDNTKEEEMKQDIIVENNEEENDEIDKIIEKYEKEQKKEETNESLKEEMLNLLDKKTPKAEPVDILKYRLANKISKKDPLLSTVHSTKSIQMLFNRNGLDINSLTYDSLNNKLNFSLKSKLTLHKEQYPPNLLPHLHSRVVLPQTRNVSV